MLRVSPPLDGLRAADVAEAGFYANGTFFPATGVGSAGFGMGLGLAMGVVVVLGLYLLSNRRPKGSSLLLTIWRLQSFVANIFSFMRATVTCVMT